MESKKIEFQILGIVHSPFKQRFGIPRQPNLVKGIPGIIELFPGPFLKQSLQGLEQFSHLWISFVFHERGSASWKPTVRPPRLDGRQRIGVLATRSPHRPNPIGLSAVKLVRIELPTGVKDSAKLHIESHDFLDGTPILDIKPYLGYSDRISNTLEGWAKERIAKSKIILSAEAKLRISLDPALKKNWRWIRECIAIDPRPAFQKRKGTKPDTIFKIAFDTYDIHWRIKTKGQFEIVAILSDPTLIFEQRRSK